MVSKRGKFWGTTATTTTASSRTPTEEMGCGSDTCFIPLLPPKPPPHAAALKAATATPAKPPPSPPGLTEHSGVLKEASKEPTMGFIQTHVLTTTVDAVIGTGKGGNRKGKEGGRD